MDILNTKIKNILTEKNTKILPSNIKKNVNILGVTGTYEGTVPTGEIEITENGTIDVSQYASANVNVSSGGDYNAKLKPLTSSDKQVQKLITELAPLDISNVTDMNYVFYTCTSLISIPEMDTSHITTCQGLCNGCTSLVNVPILNFSELTGTNHYNMFNNCPSLSNDSLNNILAMCITMAKVTNKTLKYIGLSSTQATTCQSLSNWSDFVTAGWTSGY